MPEIRGFSLNTGIERVFDSISEIARKNLPDSAVVVPGGEGTTTAVYGKLTLSGFLEEFKTCLTPEIRNRQLHIPGEMARVLDGIIEKLESDENMCEKKDALRQCLAEIREDKKLFDMYRSLLITA